MNPTTMVELLAWLNAKCPVQGAEWKAWPEAKEREPIAGLELGKTAEGLREVSVKVQRQWLAGGAAGEPEWIQAFTLVEVVGDDGEADWMDKACGPEGEPSSEQWEKVRVWVRRQVLAAGLTLSDMPAEPITRLRLASGHPVAALAAAFGPFGSLSNSEDGEHPKKLAQAVVAWVQSNDSEALPALAAEMLRLLYATDADQWTEVERLAPREVTLKTPTSGTLLTVSQKNGRFDVTVDLGERGSWTRAGQILEYARSAGAHFEAWSGERQWTHSEILDLLTARAAGHLKWLSSLPAGYYPPESHADQMEDAQAELTELVG